jgi:hypothetical protein
MPPVVFSLEHKMKQSTISQKVPFEKWTSRVFLFPRGVIIITRRIGTNTIETYFVCVCIVVTSTGIIR